MLIHFIGHVHLCTGEWAECIFISWAHLCLNIIKQHSKWPTSKSPHLVYKDRDRGKKCFILYFTIVLIVTCMHSFKSHCTPLDWESRTISYNFFENIYIATVYLHNSHFGASYNTAYYINVLHSWNTPIYNCNHYSFFKYKIIIIISAPLVETWCIVQL